MMMFADEMSLKRTDYKQIKDNLIKPFEIINIDGEEERVGTSYFNKEEADYFVKALHETPFENYILHVELMNFS